MYINKNELNKKANLVILSVREMIILWGMRKRLNIRPDIMQKLAIKAMDTAVLANDLAVESINIPPPLSKKQFHAVVTRCSFNHSVEMKTILMWRL